MVARLDVREVIRMKDEEKQRVDIGRSSGWSVDEDPDGAFRWSAYGPTGRVTGSAATREEAETAARAAEQRLLAEHERLRLGRTVRPDAPPKPPDV
jgi:hypothetical protein